MGCALHRLGSYRCPIPGVGFLQHRYVVLDSSMDECPMAHFPESALSVYLGAEGFDDLKSLLDIIEAAHWDEVLIRQSERM